MKNEETVNFCVVGMHGYSRAHISSLWQLQEMGEKLNLAAVVAHQRELDEVYASQLEARGVMLLPDLDALPPLARELDVVTLPVGIPLHVPMTQRMLAAGFTVYLEKPVAGAIQDFDQLVEAERNAVGTLLVGFQDIFQPGLWEFKQRLLDGEWGRLKRVVAMAAWPRDSAYYARNSWAGRLRVDDTWVLDSPLNNACAHHLNMALFLAGTELAAPAAPQRVQAELYRVNPIESADTMAVRVDTQAGVEVIVAASHACENMRGPLFRLECAKGLLTAERGHDQAYVWHWHPRQGGQEQIILGLDWVDPFAMLLRFFNDEANVPLCRLATARPHCVVVNGAHLSSAIADWPRVQRVERVITLADGGVTRQFFVPELNACLDKCFETACLPSESGLADWSKPGGWVDVSRLRDFAMDGEEHSYP